MSNKPVRRDTEVSGLEEDLGRIGFKLAKNAAFPPLWIYPDDPQSTRFKRAWWLYASFCVVSVPLFWPKLMAGQYLVLLFVPFVHLVLLAAAVATIGPTIVADWPARLVAPEWLPDGRMLGFLTAVPIVVGVAKYIFSGYRIADDEIGVPVAEPELRCDGAGHLPKLERDICSLVIGETGSGKSEAIKLLAYQFRYDIRTATIAHDLKDDFWQFYTTHTPLDVERLSIDDSTTIWNLFLDVEQERQFFELAKGIMGVDEQGNPFHRGARQVLAGSMIYLHRQGTDGERMPDHADLLKFLNQDVATIHRVLSEHDLPGASSLDPDVGGARNTYLTMKEYVQETFVGDFAKEGDFSLREYVENPAGRVVIIDTKSDEIDTTGPMFRLMLDMSIKYGMVSDTQTNYIMDEVDQLPRLSRLSMLASAGRGEGIRGVIGCQTLGQLEATYGKHVSGITGNCPQGLYFGPGDQETTSYILAELGQQRETITSRSEGTSGSGSDKRESTSITEREVERAPITSGDLKKFRPGDCVIKSREDWWIGRTEMLDNVRDELDDTGVGIGAQFEEFDSDLPDTQSPDDDLPGDSTKSDNRE